MEYCDHVWQNAKNIEKIAMKKKEITIKKLRQTEIDQIMRHKKNLN